MANPVNSKVSRSYNGYGKLILFGEHFVVYRLPALAASIDAVTSATVKLCDENTWSTGLVVVDERPAIPGYKNKKKKEMLESTRLVFEHFGVDLSCRGAVVTLGGNLAPVSGIGASAANCVSVSRALAAALNLSLTDQDINRAAYVGETAYHGTPSGIDNTVSTYGGVLRFQCTETDPCFTRHFLKRRVHIVFASTGITSSTTEVVADVRSFKSRNPDVFDDMSTRYMQIFTAAEKAIQDEEENLASVLGELCNKCHFLLKELGVSCSELDDLCEKARDAGALGAKLSGTGRGGLIFAICENEKSQRDVFDSLVESAPQAWMATF